MITFVITGNDGKKREAYVANDKIHSDIIKGLLEDLKLGDIRIDVNPKYNNVIGNYINFLHGKPSEITTVRKLLNCFLMNDFYFDIEYFKYLIKQLLQHYSPEHGGFVDLLDMLAQEEGENVSYYHLIREIELHLPFDLVSYKFKLRPSFVKDWLARGNNRTITFEHGKVVLDKVILTLSDYFAVDNSETMDGGTVEVVTRVTYPYDDSKVTLDKNHVPQFPMVANDVGQLVPEILANVVLPYPDAITVIRTVRGQPDVVTYYDFYPNYKLSDERVQSADVSHFQEKFSSRSWYEEEPANPADTRQLSEEKIYEDNRVVEVKEWWLNGQLKLDRHRVDDKLEIEERYSPDGEITALGYYHKGMKEGVWYNYDPATGEYSYTKHIPIPNQDVVAGYFEKFDRHGDLLEAGNLNLGHKSGRWYRYDTETGLAWLDDYPYDPWLLNVHLDQPAPVSSQSTTKRVGKSQQSIIDLASHFEEWSAYS